MWKPLLIISVFLTPIFLFGQNVTYINGKLDTNQCGKITINNTVNLDSLITFPTELGIQDIKIVDDCIEFYVVFGGGCGTTNFELITDNAITESMSPSINIFLKSTDYDFCKALVYKTIRFDLSDFNLYKKSTGLTFRIKNNSSTIIYKE